MFGGRTLFRVVHRKSPFVRPEVVRSILSVQSSGGPAKICRAVAHSYFMNVCTHSYSLVWYSWLEWERLLDWMAVRGVTMFLALTGQEEVQYRAFQRFGLSDADIRGWFNGPAFLTWSRGQNEYGVRS